MTERDRIELAMRRLAAKMKASLPHSPAIIDLLERLADEIAEIGTDGETADMAKEG